MTFINALHKKFGVTIWVFIATILLVLSLMLSVSLGVDGYNDGVFSLLMTILISIVLASAIDIRYLFASKHLDSDAEPSWAFVWVLPLAVTVVMIPWLLSGLLTSDTIPVIGSIGLWLVFAYMALLLGFIAVPFILMPIELLGHGIIMALRGNGRRWSFYILSGVYIAMIAIFGIAGTLALDNTPTSYAGWPHILFALFGLPGQYEITSLLWLWIARISGLILIGVPLSAFVANYERGGKKEATPVKKRKK